MTETHVCEQLAKNHYMIFQVERLGVRPLDRESDAVNITSPYHTDVVLLYCLLPSLSVTVQCFDCAGCQCQAAETNVCTTQSKLNASIIQHPYCMVYATDTHTNTHTPYPPLGLI